MSIIVVEQPGGGGGGGGVFQFTQSAAVNPWIVAHNLGLMPLNVVVMNSQNLQVLVETEYLDVNTVQLNFAAPESGFVTITA
jgi:hypothetical protein